MDDTTPPVRRRLAAILAADAVGYSARMARNEERAHQTLTGHRRLIDGLITDHGGRIVGTAGDSVLAEFGSAVEAVRCAVEIQDALATRNDSLLESERLHFRIGINLGDVIVDGEDILGDGVNVASRLEGIAEPGGICIASSVFDQISGKLNLGFHDIGDRSLKNIGRPVRAYRVDRASTPAASSVASHRPLIAAFAGIAALIAIAAGVYTFAGLGDGRDAPVATTAPPAPAAAPSAAPATQTVSPSQPPPVQSSPQATPSSIPPSAPEKPTPPTVERPPATPTGYVGGFAQARCQRRDGGAGPVLRGPVRVEAGEVVIALGEPGQPGHISLRGRPEADGTLVLDGFVIRTAGRGRGAKLNARYEGRLVDGRGMLTGSQGVQRCSVGLQLKQTP